MNVYPQFWLLAILPAFPLLFILLTRRQQFNNRQLTLLWLTTLLLFIVGATITLPPFANISQMAATHWQAIARYALTLSGIGILLTTHHLLAHHFSISRWQLWGCALLWLAAIPLDPMIWGDWLPTRAIWLGDRQFWWRHFDFWAVVLILSWLVPVGFAWIRTWRMVQSLPATTLRRYLGHWLGALTILLGASLLLLIYSPTQLYWQQLGAGFLVIGSWVATRTLRSVQPNLPAFPTHINPTWGVQTDPNQLARSIRQQIEQDLVTKDAWLFMVEDVPRGQLLLRPFEIERLQPVLFSAQSPFVQAIREDGALVLQDEIETAEQYADMDTLEQALIQAWNRELFVPLRAGNRLVGLLALRQKDDESAYQTADFEYLRGVAGYAGMQLYQAQSSANLRRVADHAFAQSYQQGQLVRQYQALAQLQDEYVQLTETELNKQIAGIQTTLRQLQGQSEGEKLKPTQQMMGDALKRAEQMRYVAGNLPKPIQSLQLKTVHLDTILRQVIRKLNPISRGRRVTIHYDLTESLPPIYGDQTQLADAFYHLLHNGVQFNRIGGKVTVQCGIDGHELACHIIDTGVGITPKRLANIWQNLQLVRGDVQGDKVKLGLPFVQYIIQAHGGRLSAESEYGVGSTFSVWLPVAMFVDQK